MISTAIKMIYIASHLFSFLLLSRRTAAWYALASIAGFVWIFLFKNQTFDLWSYSAAFGWGNAGFELGYRSLANILYLFGLSPSQTVVLLQLLLLALFIGLQKQVGTKPSSLPEKFILTAIVLGSVACNLAVQNGLRQGFSSVFILWAIFWLSSGRLVSAVMMILLAYLFHKSSLMFAGYSAALLWVVQSYQRSIRLSSTYRYQFSLEAVLISMAILAILAYFCIFLIFDLNVYTAYKGLEFLTNRTASVLKLVPIMGIFVTGEFLLARSKKPLGARLQQARMLRWGFLMFLIPPSFDPRLSEVMARILFFYFHLELLVILHAWAERRMVFVVFSISVYAFAFNVINVISS